jgi:glycosyltransferase involved in cell wall biosynthesis
MEPKYVVITPVRDEAKHIATTIESMVNQIIRPLEWIIVDDGSTDGTLAIIEQYAALYPWIRSKSRANRGYRYSGAGVVGTFYDGYSALETNDWDFIVKLDGDLSFSPDYFEKALKHFSVDPRLGIGGGSLYHIVNGIARLEKCPRFHVRGATKIYRKDCWKAIGGLQTAPGWDTVDEVKANMLGWITETFDDAQVVHHRFTGTAESRWKNLVKDGKADYFAGYHPLFMVVKCVRRLKDKPYVLASIAMAAGFISGYLRRTPRVDDPALIKFLRRQQLQRLVRITAIWE